MKRALSVLVLLLPALAFAQEVITPSPCSLEFKDASDGSVQKRHDAARPEGPIALGYFEADVATGRRACPRTEIGIGGRFGAIIDVPNYYGNLGINGMLFGSWALNERTEIFATLEAVNYSYAVNASLSKSAIALGHMTVGITRVTFTTEAMSQTGSNFVGSVSARLLLPTSFEIPNARLIGAEVTYLTSWLPFTRLEVHSAVGLDVSAAISASQYLPRFGGTALLGAEWKPASWFGFVLDVSGHIGARSYFAPTVAVRFRVSQLGIELGGTVPFGGTDRHDFIMGGRVTWRL